MVDSPRPLGRGSRPGALRGRAVAPVAAKTVAIRHRYPVPLPTRWLAARRLNDLLVRRRLAADVQRAFPGAAPPVVWVADPRLMAVGQDLPHRLLVFDAIDDWRFHRWAGLAAVEDGYQRAQSADLVFAVNAELLGRLHVGERGMVLFNAVDAGRWQGFDPNPLVARLPHPIVGYAGSLQWRVDPAFVAAFARRLPQGSVVAGPPMSAFWRDPTGLPGNVHLVGAVPHERMAALLAAFDVCLVPHVVDDFTASMDPLKFYEYLATGKPVVSTVPSPNPRLAPFIRIADDPGEAAGLSMSEWLGDTPELCRQRQSAVAMGDVAGTGRDGCRGVRALPGAAITETASVTAVVAHYGPVAATLETAGSLMSAAVVPERLLVVDNQGDPAAESLERLEAVAGPRLHVLTPPHNVGYAGAITEGCRRGIEASSSWIWLVNNDALPDARCLELLLAAGERYPQAGLLTPIIVDPDGRCWYAGGALDRRTLGVRHFDDPGVGRAPFETEFVTGCAFLARATAVRAVGPPDASLFMYYEDVEWGLRLQSNGWRALVVPLAKVVHHVHHIRGQRRFSPAAVYFMTRNRLVLAAGYSSLRFVLPGAVAWGLRQIVKEPGVRGRLGMLKALALGLRDGFRGTRGPLPGALAPTEVETSEIPDAS